LSCGCVVGENSGDFQIKWFSSLEECFRVFQPGDILPGPIEDGLHPLGTWKWCKCKREMFLFANIKDQTFLGFVEGTAPDGWKSPGQLLWEEVKETLAKDGINV